MDCKWGNGRVDFEDGWIYKIQLCGDLEFIENLSDDQDQKCV